MNAVDKIIFNALATRQSVLLPGVGTLRVEQKSAQSLSGRRVMAPRHGVVFSPSEELGGESIVSLITAIGSLNEEQAGELYRVWLEERRKGETLTIDRVGTLSEGRFVMASALGKALNPIPESVVRMRRRGASPRWAWILTGVIVLVLCVCCFSYFVWDFMGLRPYFAPANRMQIETIEPVVTSDSAAVSADTVAVNEAPAAESVGADAEEVIARSLAAQVAQNQPAKASVPLFHVIAGTFSVEANADRCIAELRKKHGELAFRKIPAPSGRFMVSVYSSERKDDALREAIRIGGDSGWWVWEEPATR